MCAPQSEQGGGGARVRGGGGGGGSHHPGRRLRSHSVKGGGGDPDGDTNPRLGRPGRRGPAWATPPNPLCCLHSSLPRSSDSLGFRATKCDVDSLRFKGGQVCGDRAQRPGLRGGWQPFGGWSLMVTPPPNRRAPPPLAGSNLPNRRAPPNSGKDRYFRILRKLAKRLSPALK